MTYMLCYFEKTSPDVLYVMTTTCKELGQGGVGGQCYI